MKKILISLFLYTLMGVWSTSAQAAIDINVTLNSTNFPDANLRKALAEAYNMKEGDEFQDLGIPKLTISNKNISSLKGLELIAGKMFIYLDCSHNNLKEINLYSPENFYSGHVQQLFCSYNQLTSLDVSKLNITVLDCSNNQLKTLTFDEKDMEERMWSIDCSYNQLTTLDVYHAKKLQELNCMMNNLTNIHLANYEQTALTKLNCIGNKLKTLTVMAYTNLKTLYCARNELTTLNVSNLTHLQEIKCDANQLTGLNTSSVTDLVTLSCSSNKISYLVLPARLEELSCSHNELKELDVSENRWLTTLDCSYKSPF